MPTNKIINRISIKFLASFFCLFVFMISHKTAWGYSQTLSLTPQENAWLAAHPEIRLGFNPHMEPLLIKGEDGSYDGIYPALIGELEKVLGIKINIEVGDWSPVVQKARKREIDGLLACAPSQADASNLLTTQPIHQSYPVAFTRNDAPFSIESLADLKGKTVAYQREVKMLEVALSQLEDDTEIIAVNSTLEAISLVLEGKADVAFGINFENYLLANHALFGIKLAYIDLDHASPISTCIRNDWPEFVDILNKGLTHIGKAKIQHTITEWTNIEEQAKVVELTLADHAWLDAHPVIRVGADSDWAPIEFLNKDGNYSGLSIYYLKKIESMLGVRFDFVQGSWQELIAKAKQGELDMFSCVAKTSEREKYLLFTEPYVEIPAGIFAREDTAYISNINLIIDKKIAVVEGYGIHDFLVANYPDMNLVLVKTMEEGLQTITQEKAFAFIDGIITTDHLLRRKGLLQVKLTGQAPFVYAQRMGVRKDWPQLRSILQKVIDGISDSEKKALFNQWVPLTNAIPKDYSLIWQIGTVCVFIVFLFLLWNRKLNSEVIKRTKSLLQSKQNLAMAHKASIKEQEKFNKFLDVAGFLFCSLNPKGEITLINEKGCQILNIAEDEAIGQNWFEHYIPKRQVAEVQDIFDKLMAGNIELVEYYENLILTSDGHERFIAFHNTILTDEQGSVDGIIFSGEDITARKQAEKTFQAIVRSTVGRTGQELFDNICIQLCSVLESECVIVGELIDSNTVKAIAMVVEGKPVKNYSYPLAETPSENVTCSGFCHYPKNVARLFPDDKDLQDMGAVGYVGTPLKDHKGKTIGVLSVISKKPMPLPEGTEDLMSIIAARASAEIERIKEERGKDKLEKRLQQAQKMEAIGTLAGGIAHDFNNILAVILGYTELAKDDAPPGTGYQKDLEKVLIAANRAKDLVKQILAFSRQSQVEPIPITIQPIIKEGVKMLRSSIPTTISITVDVDSKSGVILADPTQIHQILMNLCTNAYHAMEDTGGELSITLKTTFLGRDDKTKQLNITAGEYVEFTVTDTGAGIDPDIIDKIFDPYFTTKEIGQGTGMGLAIIHGIMKDSGGAITVDSQLGKGSTFHVFFPVVNEKTFLEIKEPEHLQRGKERILFIDDEELLAEMGKDMLERLGYHVTVRRRSLEALATFQNSPNEFDIVITDQTMPGMTGSDLARRMMQIRPDIPIILCTGYSNLIDEDSAKGLGIKEFALKPLTKGVISTLIRKVLDN